MGIGASDPGMERSARFGIEVRDLACGMNTGIGTAGRNSNHRIAGDDGERTLHLILHTAAR